MSIEDRNDDVESLRKQRDAALVKLGEQLMEPSIEELLQEAAYWEDPKSMILMAPAGENGGVFLCRYDGTRPVEAETLRKALTAYIEEKNR